MKDLNHGLDLLADEATPAPIDVHDVIAKAKARTRDRRAAAGTALATVAAVAAIAVTIGGDKHGNGLNPAVQTTTSTPPDGCKIDTKGTTCEVAVTVDQQSLKLTQQLAAARDTVIPAQFTVEPSAFPMNGNGEPLTFVTNGIGGTGYYAAFARLTDSQGSVEIAIDVVKLAPGTPLGHVNSLPVSPCTPGEGNCEERMLAAGTVARATTNARPPGVIEMNYMSAVRPDGTYVQVMISAPQGIPTPRPTLPLTLDDLFKFATVFTF